MGRGVLWPSLIPLARLSSRHYIGSMPISFSPPRAPTSGRHHFFGYYGICPWSDSQRCLICLESTFHHRPPEAEDTATVGLVDLAAGQWTPLAQTRALNLQQGAMLHWLAANPDSQILFNDRQQDQFVTTILNIHTRDVMFG